MKGILIRFLLVIMLIAFISLVLAQDQLPLGSDTSSSNLSWCPSLQYLQYYVMPQGAVPSILISKPTEINTSSIDPITHFPLNSEGKKIKYAQQGASASNENSLLIQGLTEYSQYVAVPKGSIVSLIAISPNGGNGSLNETCPDGAMQDFALNFYPQSQLAFYAETIGKYILFIVIDGKASNNVEINVVANCTSKADVPFVELDNEPKEIRERGIEVKRFPIIGEIGQDTIKDCKFCE
jgi:hypothetical protein